MIITREIIQNITCEESIAWFEEHPYFYDMDRKQFNKLLRDQEKAGLTPNTWWADWAEENLTKAGAIVHSKKLKRLGVYKAVGPNLTPQEVDNIEDAISILEAAKKERIKLEDEVFQIQLRRHTPEGMLILKFCDTTQDTCFSTPEDYFATFNLNTGLYEEFPTFIQAKNRMIELRDARQKAHADAFLIYEKIAEVGGTDVNAEDFVVVETLMGRKSLESQILDSVEKRPDPKPKNV